MGGEGGGGAEGQPLSEKQFSGVPCGTELALSTRLWGTKSQ